MHINVTTATAIITAVSLCPNKVFLKIAHCINYSINDRNVTKLHVELTIMSETHTALNKVTDLNCFCIRLLQPMRFKAFMWLSC